VNGIPQWQSDRLAVLLDACTGAGLTVSAQEQHTLSWLAGWEPETVEAIAGLIRRAGGSARISHERMERYAGTLARDRDEAGELAALFPGRSLTAQLYRERESVFRQALDTLHACSEGAYGATVAEQTGEVDR
jgi:hypothetical protein